MTENTHSDPGADFPYPDVPSRIFVTYKGGTAEFPRNYVRHHIVRELAYQGVDGKLLFGLCGAWPQALRDDGTPITFPHDHRPFGRVPLCGNCERLWEGGSR